MDNPKKYCILLHKSGFLLNQAVISLASLEKRIEIVFSDAIDTNELAREISKINPDVVLLNESQPVASREVLTKLLTTLSKIKIVVVSADSNWLHVFNKEDLLLTRFEDLLTVIKAD